MRNGFPTVVMLSALVAILPGCGSRTTFDNLREVEALIGGRSAKSGVLGSTQKEVVSKLGKPDLVFAGGSLKDKSDDEVWKYYDLIRHEATGKLQRLVIHFAKGRVLQVDLE